MIGLILLWIVAFLAWYLFIKPLKYWTNLGVKQTNPWPFFGDSWTIAFRRMSFCEFVEWIYNMHPNARYVGFYQFTTPTLSLNDPELIKQITVKDFDHFVDHRPFIDPDADPLWGGNLFSLRGQKWREMRATLSGSFTSSKMKTMFHLMEETAVDFVKYFINKNEDLIELEMKDTYTRYTNDVIATTAFGIKVDSLTDPQNAFFQMGKRATNFNGIVKSMKFLGYLVVPKLFKLFKVKLFEADVSLFFKNVIDETIKTREEQGIVRPDLINLLMETRKGRKIEETETIDTGFATVKESEDIGKFKQVRNLTNDTITAQALIFFFAGFDSISTAMCFGTHELALNKDVQDKLRKEINQTYKETNGKLTYEALLKMKYMDMVVSEIVRKWPPAVGIDRVCTKPYVIEPVTPDEKPLTINLGDVMWLPIQGIHRNPNYYPNPEKFDPERFSDENKDSIIPYSYIPFGSGPRNCIGSRFALLEVKVLLFNLLLHFEIVPTKKTQNPIKLNRKSFNHTAEGGFWFGLKRFTN